MTEARLIGWLVGLILVLAAVFFGFRAVYDAGVKSGAEGVQTAFDQFKADSERAATDQAAKNSKDKEAALANNEGVINDLQTQLTSVRSTGSNLAKRLSDAEARAGSCSGILSKTSDQLRAATGSINASLGQINDAVANTINECGANNAKYSALIKQLGPQL